ncbi:hypothetical protein G5I_09260 [Acromyrmex echinatior]|uniref:Uncharacterized protein n=1 Tax=Acromyrmex echinatior TaxID=103372 RepID=F4WTR0_ACREC|nr:hypothetical protein G5I_09260 [Acromyrmex echinatior]
MAKDENTNTISPEVNSKRYQAQDKVINSNKENNSSIARNVHRTFSLYSQRPLRLDLRQSSSKAKIYRVAVSPILTYISIYSPQNHSATLSAIAPTKRNSVSDKLHGQPEVPRRNSSSTTEILFSHPRDLFESLVRQFPQITESIPEGTFILVHMKSDMELPASLPVLVFRNDNCVPIWLSDFQCNQSEILINPSKFPKFNIKKLLMRPILFAPANIFLFLIAEFTDTGNALTTTAGIDPEIALPTLCNMVPQEKIRIQRSESHSGFLSFADPVGKG